MQKPAAQLLRSCCALDVDRFFVLGENPIRAVRGKQKREGFGPHVDYGKYLLF
jgi:hypothetical protein